MRTKVENSQAKSNQGECYAAVQDKGVAVEAMLKDEEGKAIAFSSKSLEAYSVINVVLVVVEFGMIIALEQRFLDVDIEGDFLAMIRGLQDVDQVPG